VGQQLITLALATCRTGANRIGCPYAFCESVLCDVDASTSVYCSPLDGADDTGNQDDPAEDEKQAAIVSRTRACGPPHSSNRMPEPRGQIWGAKWGANAPEWGL